MSTATVNEETLLNSSATYGAITSASILQSGQLPEFSQIVPQGDAHLFNLTSESRDVSGADVLGLSWDDHQNIENPYNWSLWWKYRILTLLTVTSHLTSMLYAPGIPSMQRDFGSHNDTLATFSMSIYVLGFSIGPLLFAPLSEVYGRAIFYQCYLCAFLCLTAACALSSSIVMLVVIRFFAGCFGAAPVAIGGAMVFDLFRVDERGLAMAIYHSGPIFGNLLGPPLGGFIIQYRSWRWVFWIITIFAALALICSSFILRETHVPTILRKLHADKHTEANDEARLDQPDPADRLFQAIKRPLRLLFFSPVTMACSLIISIVAGTMNLIFASLGRIFQDYYSFSVAASGLIYLGVTMGFLVGAFIFGWTSDRISQWLTWKNNGLREAEFRLPALMIGLPLVVVGLLWYGWAVQNQTFWAVVTLGLGVFGMGVTTVQLSLQTYTVDSFTEFSASALAAMTVTRCIGGSLIPLLGPILYQTLGLGWGNTALALSNLTLCTVPCILYVQGKVWREEFLQKMI